MPWIDTHCHLDAPEFDADRDAVWQRARAAGVTAPAQGLTMVEVFYGDGPPFSDGAGATDDE